MVKVVKVHAEAFWCQGCVMADAIGLSKIDVAVDLTGGFITGPNDNSYQIVKKKL